MIEYDHFQLMAAYNRWMNDKLFAVCADIPDADRRRDMGAFFGSIDATLDHIYYGDRAWLDRFDASAPSVTLGKTTFADFNALWQARRTLDDTIVAFARSLSKDWLDTPFRYTSQVDDQTRVLPARVLVSHMFNHQTHHRGQVTTLVKQLGFDPGVTDIPWLPALDAVID